jgi:hypothetical protein
MQRIPPSARAIKALGMKAEFAPLIKRILLGLSHARNRNRIQQEPAKCCHKGPGKLRCFSA